MTGDFELTGLTWIKAARERVERAASQLSSLDHNPDQRYAADMLAEAADELRTAANHCDDSARAMRRGRRA